MWLHWWWAHTAAPPTLPLWAGLRRGTRSHAARVALPRTRARAEPAAPLPVTAAPPTLPLWGGLRRGTRSRAAHVAPPRIRARTGPAAPLSRHGRTALTPAVGRPTAWDSFPRRARRPPAHSCAGRAAPLPRGRRSEVTRSGDARAHGWCSSSSFRFFLEQVLLIPPPLGVLLGGLPLREPLREPLRDSALNEGGDRS